MPKPAPDEDARLLFDFSAGSAEAFETLLKKYFPRVMNFIYRYVGNKNTAEDLTQEVFMRAYKSCSTYTPQAKFKTWLYTIARNAAINELKRNKHKTAFLDAAVKDERAPEADKELVRTETAEAVKSAISHLPENQRTAVILYRYEEFSYQEIAKTMHISEKAVKSLLSRARENLRNFLTPYLFK